MRCVKLAGPKCGQSPVERRRELSSAFHLLDAMYRVPRSTRLS